MMVREMKSHHGNSKTKGARWWFPPSLRLLSVLRRVVISTCFFWGIGAAHAEVSQNVGVHGTCGPIEFSIAKGQGDWAVSAVFSGVKVSAVAPSDEEEGHVVPAFSVLRDG